MIPTPSLDNRIPVAVLGATGSVGQRFVQLLDGHPYFRVAELTALGAVGGQALPRGRRLVPGDPAAAGGRRAPAAADRSAGGPAFRARCFFRRSTRPPPTSTKRLRPARPRGGLERQKPPHGPGRAAVGARGQPGHLALLAGQDFGGGALLDQSQLLDHRPGAGCSSRSTTPSASRRCTWSPCRRCPGPAFPACLRWRSSTT